jgi:alpha-galactosidase
MARITLIGAGSLVFSKALVMDILAVPELRDSEIVLMSRTAERVGWAREFVHRVITDNRLPATVQATTDRRRALDGADHVIAMIQVGGADAVRKDYEIPLRYGVDQCIGDTLGPGGVMRAARTIPVMLDIAADMQELCPDALLLNYVNPMGAICEALGREMGLQFVGLCHGVQTTLDLIAGYVGVPKEEIEFLCAGINHMAWFLKLERGGRDLYPVLRERIERPEYYLPEKVRCEVMRHFGYFMTESSGHLSEYLPYFRKNREALDLYCDQPGFGGESGAAPKNYERVSRMFRSRNFLAEESSALGQRGIEYGSYIIEARETGRAFRFNGNVRNDGLIANLPEAACVEVPILVDAMGLHPVPVGELPPGLAALCQTNVTVQTLCVEAVVRRDLELLFQAIALDPLSAAVLTLKEIREMAGELIEAERQYLEVFSGQRLEARPTIVIPPGTQAVRTPLDPALAVVKNLQDLSRKAAEGAP